MLPSELAAKPFHLWSLEDLNLIVERQSEESQFLEFKARLPLSDDAKGWESGSKLHRSEKEGIAKAVVALANAYGGHFIVGIKDSNDNPKRAASLATPIPRLADYVESLRASLGALIDPPINALAFQPISTNNGDDSGYLVVEVPQSIHAPHGFGEPPKAFVRRADKSEPMTMRDMQNVFWEARTRRERVDAELAAFGRNFDRCKVEGKFFRFGFCAVSENQFGSQDILGYLQARDAERPSNLRDLFETGSAIPYSDGPSNYRRWLPTSRGLSQAYEFRDQFRDLDYRGEWLIDDSGCVSLTGSCEGQPPRPGVNYGSDPSSPGLFIHPANLVASLKQFLDLVRLMSLADQAFCARWIIKGWFKSGHSDFYFPAEHVSYSKHDFTLGVDFRPITIDVENTTSWPDFLERRIWESLGVKRPEGRTFSLPDALKTGWTWK